MTPGVEMDAKILHNLL